MSYALINRNADLKRLRDEGYFVQIQGGFLVMREVPYVTQQNRVQRGTLISKLTMAGDETRKPNTHVIEFDGDYPCYSDGKPIEGIRHQSKIVDLGHGLTARHSFSSKPPAGYLDYYHKMTTYAHILAGPASTLEPSASPCVFRAPEGDDACIFNYIDTASDLAGIGAFTEKLREERIAIVGLGGTGAYVLDLVAKTPVREIRLLDGDEFLLHNAFRAPGAPTLEKLREAPTKVEYLKDIYAQMHRGICAYPVNLATGNLHLLDGTTFCFICVDSGAARRRIVEKLESIGAAFIDAGMGLQFNKSLGGILRITASTPENREVFHQSQVPLADDGDNGIYGTNIQVAELNALIAALAVVKWKKLRGFYRDLEGELQCTYTTDGNTLDSEGRRECVTTT